VKKSEKKLKRACKHEQIMLVLIYVRIERKQTFVKQQIKENIFMSSVSYTKNTSRFAFDINRNDTAKKAGGNSLVISTLPAEGQQYATGTTSVNMTIKEAKALQGFLNQRLPISDS